MIGYRDNYDQIAAEHLILWRATGENPWQPPAQVEAMLKTTAELVMAYSEPGDAVLDAGCAMGDLLMRLTGRGRYGLDINQAYLDVAAERGIAVTRADVEAMPYPVAHFDAVLATDILEHVLDLNAAVREMVRVLKPGGVLVVRSPDSEDLTPYLEPDYRYRFVHLRRFDEASFRLLFDRVFGLEVLEIKRVCSGAVCELIVVARKP